MTHYPVTFHAVLRYLTRIENVRLRRIAAAVDAPERASRVAFEACRQLGIDFNELQRRILPGKFLPVLSSVHSIKLETHICKVDGGQVVTVIKRNEKHRLARIPTAKELRNTRRRRRGCRR